MRKFIEKYAGAVACLALLVTTITANSACIYVMHQPELPTAAKNLRKF